MPLKSARLSGNKRLVSASSHQPDIAAGETDEEAVAILQTCLVELGYAMPRSTKPNRLLDGIFGQETIAIVKKFQHDNGLKADGIVGRNTLGKLDAIFDALVKADHEALVAAIANPQGGIRIV